MKKIEGYDIKVTLVGDSSVGKTTICNKLMGNNNSSSEPTIGSKCEVKLIDSGKSSIFEFTSLWDTCRSRAVSFNHSSIFKEYSYIVGSF